MGQVFFYRARVSGPVAAVLSLSAGPVRPAPGPGSGLGQVRLTLRYALAPTGRICTHRGWLYVDLPAGSRLALAGYQADGDGLLLSLRPLRPSQATAQQLQDRFRLPFWLPHGLDGPLHSLTARVRANCRPLRNALQVWGHLLLEVEGAVGRQRVALPFCRLLTAAVDPQLWWQAAGVVAELSLRAEEGEVAGEAVVAALCLGRSPVGLVVPAPPAVAVVREVSGRVLRLSAEVAGEELVLVKGWLEVEIDWADQAGFSRSTSRETPFACTLALPGLQAGDRLEAVADLDRLSWLNNQLFALVAVGVTALRCVHLGLSGQYYRVEQVMGQAVGTVEVAEPLFCPPAPPLEPILRLPAEAPLPAGGELGPPFGLHFKGPVAAGRGWQVVANLSPGRQRLPLGGAVPAGAIPLVTGLEGLGPDSVRVRSLAVDPALNAFPVNPHTQDANHTTSTELDLPAPVRAISSLALVRGTPWEARVLVHLLDELRLFAIDLVMPGGELGDDWQPQAVLATVLSTERIRVSVNWKRIIGKNAQ